MILALLAVGVTIILFSLPRVVVENDSDVIAEDAVSELVIEESERIDLEERKEPIPPQYSTQIESLKTQLNQGAENSKEFYNFADSLAKLYQSFNWYDSAEKYIDILLTDNENAEVLARAGQLYYEWNNTVEGTETVVKRKAAEYFDRAIGMDSSRLDWQLKRALLDVSGANPMKGILAIRALADANPAFEDAQYQLGILSMQTGQTENARMRFQQVVDINPANYQARLFLGIILQQMGEAESSREQFNAVVEGSSNEELIEVAKSHL